MTSASFLMQMVRLGNDQVQAPMLLVAGRFRLATPLRAIVTAFFHKFPIAFVLVCS